MQLRSLSQLATYARKLADAQGQTALERHTDADVFAAVNAGYSAFRRELVRAGGVSLSMQSAQIAMVTGQTLYTMPGDFLSLWSISLAPNSAGQADWLLSQDAVESATVRTWDQSLPAYTIVGTQLELRPSARTGQQLTIVYAPMTADLAVGTDMVQCLEDYVAKWAARDLATKDKAWDLRDRLSADLQELVPHIRVVARQRDGANTPRVRDTWQERQTYARRRWWP